MIEKILAWIVAPILSPNVNFSWRSDSDEWGCRTPKLSLVLQPGSKWIPASLRRLEIVSAYPAQKPSAVALANHFSEKHAWGHRGYWFSLYSSRYLARQRHSYRHPHASTCQILTTRRARFTSCDVTRILIRRQNLSPCRAANVAFRARKKRLKYNFQSRGNGKYETFMYRTTYLISLQWNLLQLRKQKFNLTVKQLVEYSGLNLRSASRRTYSRCLNNMGFRFLQARKKGLLNDKHIKSRVRYARKMLLHERTNPGFWTNEVGFYLDGVSFVYNHNIWRSILFKILWVLYHVLQ